MKSLDTKFRIISNNLIVRFYQSKDFPKWQKLFSDMNPKQNQWDWEPEKIEELTEERFKKKLEFHQKERKTGNVYYFCVEEKTVGDLIGIVIINNIDYEKSECEIGFQISNKCREKVMEKNLPN